LPEILLLFSDELSFQTYKRAVFLWNALAVSFFAIALASLEVSPPLVPAFGGRAVSLSFLEVSTDWAVIVVDVLFSFFFHPFVFLFLAPHRPPHDTQSTSRTPMNRRFFHAERLSQKVIETSETPNGLPTTLTLFLPMTPPSLKMVYG